jgi:signal transduction histidine kinase
VIASNYDVNQPPQQEAAMHSQAYLFNAPPQVQPPESHQVADLAVESGQPAAQAVGQQQAYGGGSAELGRQQRAQSRDGNDLPNRTAALQSYAQRSRADQRNSLRSLRPPMRVVEGVSRTLWLGERLVLARRVQIGDQIVIQGCWLDWNALQQRLREEVTDLLPDVEFLPLSAAERNLPGPRLASIPVRLVVAMPLATPARWSPIRVSLLVAWSCLLLAAVAGAITLYNIIALSERRGAFVSAVTHELRTPLTTFRMYAEMLAEGMVPDAQQRQAYLHTLRVEADRLSHLVENVLQYARLERGRPGKRREPVALADLVGHCQSRLAERAAQAGMTLVAQWDQADGETIVATDLGAVEQILFNLVDNACKYAGHAHDKRIHLELAALPRQVKIAVRDHGPGISAAGRKRLFQPFSKSVHEAAHSAPGVGLGLALSRRLASDLGGRLELHLPADGGAAFVLTLPR